MPNVLRVSKMRSWLPPTPAAIVCAVIHAALLMADPSLYANRWMGSKEARAAGAAPAVPPATDDG